MSGARQPLLFRLPTPLPERLGPEFPGSVPERPGVYFFRDHSGVLLYIGQSGNLRRRLASYRHVSPDRHPRRTLRLVNRIARVDWRICGTAQEAEALERILLLEYRPPFNRAGTWQGPPWWFEAEVSEDRLTVRIVRNANTEDATGPLPSSFRYVFGSLIRCSARVMAPSRALWDFPPGLFASRPPASWDYPCPDPSRWHELVCRFVRRESMDLIDQTEALQPAILHQGEREFWEEELERLRRFAATSPLGNEISEVGSNTAPPEPESPDPHPAPPDR